MYEVKKKKPVIQKMLGVNRAVSREFRGKRDDDEWGAQAKKSQFLNPVALRGNLSAQGFGGEAHHIIPGCVVEAMGTRYGWLRRTAFMDKNFFNDAWNGIVLRGTIREGVESRSFGGDNQTVLNLPYHRKNGLHNHPIYNRYVTRKLQQLINSHGSYNIEAAVAVANHTRRKIESMDSSQCLDDIR